MSSIYATHGLALAEEPVFYDDDVDESELDNEKYYDFQWELYDWSKFDPKKFGYDVIRLMGDPANNRRKSPHSGRYFTVITRSMRRFLLSCNPFWYPHVEYKRDQNGEYIEPREIKRITAHYNEGPRKSRKVKYMHRILAEAEGLEVGDHINGYSLDNRNCNLRPLSLVANNHNTRRVREAFPELLPGVWWSDRTHQRVVGVVRVDGKNYRSEPMPFEEQEKAWQWCAKKKLELFGLKKLANGPITVPLPEFPPRIRRNFLVRGTSSIVSAKDEIPF